VSAGEDCLMSVDGDFLLQVLIALVAKLSRPLDGWLAVD